MRFFALLLCAVLFAAAPVWAGFKVHRAYNSQEIKTFEGNYNETLTLERGYVKDVVPKGIERIQIRATSGKIIAYTPARVTAIPFCFGANSCWVFMWKTVYPFPAIYKFNSNPQTWSEEKDPPLQYERSRFSGSNGKGFTELRFNPFFGTFGVGLFYLKNAWYFCICIFLTIILCLQITKFRDLPAIQQKWIRQLISILFITTTGPIGWLPIEPYMITAIVIMLSGSVAIIYLGVPFVLTIATVMAAFSVCCMRLAKIKRKKLRLA